MSVNVTCHVIHSSISCPPHFGQSTIARLPQIFGERSYYDSIDGAAVISVRGESIIFVYLIFLLVLTRNFIDGGAKNDSVTCN